MRILPASEYMPSELKMASGKHMWVSAFCFILLDVGVVLSGPDPPMTMPQRTQPSPRMNNPLCLVPPFDCDSPRNALWRSASEENKRRVALVRGPLENYA
jgi:hypothetical protein